MGQPLLEVSNLRTCFYTRAGSPAAVDDVSFTISQKESLGIVGESGCGKTITALSIMRLIQIPPGRIERGSVLLDGENLLTKSDEEMRRIRGERISMVFQEPMTSLDPVFTIGQQLIETVRSHRKVSKREAWDLSVEMLHKVQIPEPVSRMSNYPHELSGGMRQRVMIAMALTCRPKLLIADEPSTALDVTTQAQILALLNDLREETGMSLMLITHALGVVAEVADRVAVMYASRIVEYAPVGSLYANPRHPYTIGLLHSIPDIEMTRERLYTIPGTVPNLVHPPPGCYFWPRCPHALEVCHRESPAMRQVNEGHFVACWWAQ